MVSAPTTPARVVFADDDELGRRLLRLALDAHDALEVVGEATDGAEALALARSVAPDILLLDLTMPELDGLAVAECVRTEFPTCAIIIFSATEHAEAEAHAAGAHRFVPKSAGATAAARAAAELALDR
jgi:DNA-binding NarL/FixJ family response regulator